jgi:NAD+ synthase
MEKLLFTENLLQKEVEKIIQFIREETGGYNLLLGVSGGIDSDVTARLCHLAIGSERLKCFIVLQDDFDPRYIEYARRLTEDLKIKLVEIPFAPYPKELMSIISQSDPDVGFIPDPAYLDIGRSKCALRTFIFSAYAERGYLVVGPSNRTELELGYFLPFGDRLAHISPIIHLYKSQVQQIAKFIGTRAEVMNLPPAAGFWVGDEDLRGIAYWLFNEAPIKIDLKLTQESKEVINQIRQELSFYAIDTSLRGINLGWDALKISQESGLSLFVVEKIIRLSIEAFTYKRRKLGAMLK